MKDIDWRTIDRHELAAWLGDAPSVSSRAVGDTTIYRLAHDGREVLAIAPPGDAVIVVAKPAPPARRRRRIDTTTLTPAPR